MTFGALRGSMTSADLARLPGLRSNKDVSRMGIPFFQRLWTCSFRGNDLARHVSRACASLIDQSPTSP